MHAIRRLLPALFAAQALLQRGLGAAANATSAVDPAVLARIRDAAMSSDWAWQRLTVLADTTGPRLSGSPGAEAAVVQVAQSLRASGLRVQLQPVKAPRWVHGEERGELVGYAGRPEG
jgi:carboxypeptidase Q